MGLGTKAVGLLDVNVQLLARETKEREGERREASVGKRGGEELRRFVTCNSPVPVHARARVHALRGSDTPRAVSGFSVPLFFVRSFCSLSWAGWLRCERANEWANGLRATPNA